MYASTKSEPENTSVFKPMVVVSPGLVFVRSSKQFKNEDEANSFAERDMRDLHSQIIHWMNNRGYLQMHKE